MWVMLLFANQKSQGGFTSFSSNQEIMVGSMFQAEIPAGTCKYRENEKGEIGPFIAAWDQCLIRRKKRLD